MKLGAHQINLMPWLPFFHKMQQSDIFVLMIHCQFEKNGYQNRALVKDQWWTLPVNSGTCAIKDKVYVNGLKLTDINVPLILGFAKMLGIDTNKIHYDFPTESKGTTRIVEICHRFNCNEYLTNPAATSKYLDAIKIIDAGIKIIPCEMPPEYNIHLFEAFERFGIEGTTKIIQKEYKSCKA